MSIRLIIASSWIFSINMLSQEDNKNLENSLSAFKFRNIGPAVTSGRVSDFAVQTDNPNEFFVAVASGGVWKTTNGGHTWLSIFDNQESYSIGCVEIDPNDRNIVWVGTGENNSQRSVGYGTGVYKSTDGGVTWKNMGLKESQHIGKIEIDKRNSNIIYVAAQGPLWNSGGQRGFYKSTDGGNTWRNTLTISENTGVTDIVIDTKNPDIIYCASYQRRRHVWTLINGGPESAIYKSTDAGETWNKLNNGLPSGDLGRIGLAISQTQSNIVYAIIEASNGGGFYRSTNNGSSWNKMSNKVSGSPQYYQEIVVDPLNFNKIYCLDTYTAVSEDGGKSFNTLGNQSRHVDDHAIWINPIDTQNIMIGGDGGIYTSYDGGQNWRHFENLPTVQFYKISVDNDYPFYNVYGGTQDNNSLGAPSQTINSNGILNQDWTYIRGGDGFKPVVDPKDPYTIYCQAQYASIARYDKRTRQFIGIKPQEDEGEELRWNWSSPIIISPHDNNTLYYAANKVFKSTDKGDSWIKISNDLTKQIDRNGLSVMGKIWNPEAVAKNASTSLYGNIVSLDESPIKKGLIIIGTDDGLIQITDNDGVSWSKVENIPGIPTTSYVSDIKASQHNENVIYACFDNHKMGDFKPYLAKSVDKGKTWNLITKGLPEKGTVFSFDEDHIEPKLLFCGTEFNLFVSFDGGTNWLKFAGGLPTIKIADIEIQRRENDLVLGTFGRGIYILDDYSPLRQFTKSEFFNSNAAILPIKNALAFVVENNQGQSWAGETLYKGKNKDFGASITYFVKDKYESKKDLRKKEEKKQYENNSYKYPTFEQLQKEDAETMPYLLFTIKDSQGNLVRRLKANYSQGVSKINWDLRYSDLSPIKNNFDLNTASGSPVPPGQYTIEMDLVESAGIKNLAPPQTFKVYTDTIISVTQEEMKISANFKKEYFDFYREIQNITLIKNSLEEGLANLEKALLVNSNEIGKIQLINLLKSRILEQNIILNGNRSISKRNENQTPSINERYGENTYAFWYANYKPTQTILNSFEVMKKQFKNVEQEIRNINDEYRQLLNTLKNEKLPPIQGFDN